jgi:hypothetical protein
VRYQWQQPTHVHRARMGWYVHLWLHCDLFCSMSCRTNTLASMKRAQQAGDEWARIFALQIQVLPSIPQQPLQQCSVLMQPN